MADSTPQEAARSVLSQQQQARLAALDAARSGLAASTGPVDAIDLVSVARYVETGEDPWAAPASAEAATSVDESSLAGRETEEGRQTLLLEIFSLGVLWKWRFGTADGGPLGRSFRPYRALNDCLNGAAATVGIHPDAMTDGNVVARLTGDSVEVRIIGKGAVA